MQTLKYKISPTLFCVTELGMAGEICSVSLSGNYAICSTEPHAIAQNGDYCVQVVDFSNPAIPQIVSSLSPNAPIEGVCAWNDLFCVCERFNGFSIFDITDASNPVLLGRSDPFSDDHCSISVTNEIVAIASSIDGVWFHNRGQGDDPSPILTESAACFTTDGNAVQVFLDGNIAYVIDTHAMILVQCGQWTGTKPLACGQEQVSRPYTGLVLIC